MKRRPWTQADDAMLRESYADTPTRAIARRLGRTDPAVYNRARTLGLSKSEAYLRESGGRLNGVIGMACRFTKGQTPWNKGKPFDAGGRSHEMQFKPGEKPHTWVPVGSERVTKDGYIQRKVTDTGYPPRDWRGLHTLIWEQHNGPLPDGHIVIFADGDKRNFDPANLHCISRAENMRRNTVWRYPRPVAEAIVMRGALKRRIREATRDAKQNG